MHSLKQLIKVKDNLLIPQASRPRPLQEARKLHFHENQKNLQISWTANLLYPWAPGLLQPLSLFALAARMLISHCVLFVSHHDASNTNSLNYPLL